MKKTNRRQTLQQRDCLKCGIEFCPHFKHIFDFGNQYQLASEVFKKLLTGMTRRKNSVGFISGDKSRASNNNEERCINIDTPGNRLKNSRKQKLQTLEWSMIGI